MNNSEFVSRVINGLKSLGKDNRISRRYILKTGQEKAKFLISQKLNDRSLYREANVFRTLKCFEMERIDVVSCPIIEFKTCSTIMRSKKKLPELIYSKYGSSIKSVTSLDGEIEINSTTPAQHRLDKKRLGYKDKAEYYDKEGSLYIINKEIFAVDVELIPTDLYDLDQCSECREKNCKSAWDYEFVCSDKLLESVVQETIKEVSISKQVQADQNPNLNEGS